MREYGLVYSKFWTNPEMQGLDDTTKLLALYLLSGPHTNSIGCYRIPTGYAAEDLNKTSGSLAEAFQKLHDMTFIRRDFTTGWTLIPNYLRFNVLLSRNAGIAAERLFADIPKDSPIRDDAAAAILANPKQFSKDFLASLTAILKASGSLPEGIAQVFATQEQEQEQDTKIKIKDVSAEAAENPPPSTPAAPPSEPTSPTEITFDCIQSKVYVVTTSQRLEWEKTFPAVNVPQELRQMRAWIEANPTKRKTIGGCPRFIVAWLSREQDKGGTPTRPGKSRALVGSHGADDFNPFDTDLPEDLRDDGPTAAVQ